MNLTHGFVAERSHHKGVLPRLAFPLSQEKGETLSKKNGGKSKTVNGKEK
ncbi:hypothetical protein ACS3QZ_17020 [Shimia sp. W99]